jgi:hypothetical protein
MHSPDGVTGGGNIPAPSDAVLIKLAGIAERVRELMALDSPVGKAPVGLNTIRNDRRRTVEAIMLLLSDPEVRDYLAELERLGLLRVKR